MMIEYDGKMDITFCIPCLDSEKNIIDTIVSIREAMDEFDYTYEIIIIDDHSKDNSAAVVEDHLLKNPDLSAVLLKNETTFGLGHNYVEGAITGNGKYYKIVHSGNLERKEGTMGFIKHIGEADIITNYLNDDRSLFRRFVSKFYTLIIGILSGYSLQYYHGAALVLRADVLRYHPNNLGTSFLAEFLVILLNKGRSVKEIEITPIYRTNSRSKAISWRNVISALQCFINILLRRFYR